MARRKETYGLHRRWYALREIAKRNWSPSYIIYRAKWNLAENYDYLPSFPLHLDIETTSACNLKCAMCPHGTGDMKDIGAMDFDFACSLIDQAAEMGTYSIKLNWRGEPGLYPRLPELIKYAKDKKILEVQLNTNGLPYDKNKIAEMIQAGLDRIIFSVDGATKETYEAIRKGGNFEKLMQNIKSFISIRNKLGKTSPFVRLQFLRMKRNSHEVGKFINMWKDHADDLRISEVTYRGQRDELFLGDRVAVGRRRCPQPWQRMIISWSGKVMPCCSDWYCQWVVGDAHKTPLIALWKNKRMEKLRQLNREVRLNEFEPCKSCYVNKSYLWKRKTETKSTNLDTLLKLENKCV